MTLEERLRTYIDPDDSMEDHDDIRALMIAGADRIRELEAEVRSWRVLVNQDPDKPFAVGRPAEPICEHTWVATTVFGDNGVNYECSKCKNTASWNPAVWNMRINP